METRYMMYDEDVVDSMVHVEYDPVNNPEHYNAGQIETIDYIVDVLGDYESPARSHCLLILRQQLLLLFLRNSQIDLTSSLHSNKKALSSPAEEKTFIRASSPLGESPGMSQPRQDTLSIRRDAPAVFGERLDC